MERLDVYVSKQGFTRSYAAKLIKAGRVLVDGKIQKKPSFSISEENRIEIEDFEAKEIETIPENIPLDVVYEDDDLLVVNKPRGMVVHPSKGHTSGTLVNALLGRKGSLSTIGGEIRPGIVHRLDKDTSGLMLVAKNDTAHLGLSKQIEKHEVIRIYNTLVGGIVDKNGTIETNIARSKNNRLKMTVVREPNGRKAITHYTPLEIYNKYSLVEIKLETGRTHQVRVHMAHIGRPVAGDPVYGRGENFFKGHILHSKKIRFKHPRTEEIIELETELPQYFQEAIHHVQK